MSRPISRLSVVALVALTAVSVCIVFVVLRIISERQLVYEDEIPIVDKDEIPVFAAEVSTISLPIKADYAALACKIRDAARDEIKTPCCVTGGSFRIPTGATSIFLYYSANLLSLDITLGNISGVPESLGGARSAGAQRPFMRVNGSISLRGSIQEKLNTFFFGDKKLAELGHYNGKFLFSKSYSVGLDESAKLIFGDLGQANMAPLGKAELKLGPVPFKDWFGGLKKLIMPEVGKRVDKALKQNVEADYLTPFYDKGWVALHKPIKLTSGVWLVFHPEEFQVAPLRSSGTTLETTVTVRGRPKVVLGDKPQVPQVPPMPPVQLREAKGGLHVVVDAIVPLDEVERLLNKELGGLEDVIYNQAKVRVKVPKARIYSRENWLRLELLLTKPFRGSVFLEGAPRYDPENNELYVEGLDFTVDTKNVLAKSASWLLERPLLKDYLQTKVRLPVGGPLAKVGKAIRKYKEEVPGYGVVFQGETTSFKMLGVYNTREAIHFIVQADGSAEVTMKPPAPSPPKAVKINGT